MDSNRNYSQFIEHSFRRLNLLIRQQDDRETYASTSDNKGTEKQLSRDNRKNSSNRNEVESKKRYDQSSINDSNSVDTKRNVEPMFRSHRTYMRPPKSRTTVLYRCSSLPSTDRPETSVAQPLDTPPPLPVPQEKASQLPIHMPHERTVYDVRFEKDRQNDIREKYNIPLPFQRKWLRQPRYVPQERPNIGQTHQSKNP